MPTTRETILAALHARLQPLAALTLRDEVLPERIPAAGLIILRDGKPGDPEVTLSPLTYFYEHRAELEVVIQAGTGSVSLFDALTSDIGAARDAERAVDGVTGLIVANWVDGRRLKSAPVAISKKTPTPENP
jgi:hypothetical protein